MRTRGEGVQNPKKFADVLYVWPLCLGPKQNTQNIYHKQMNNAVDIVNFHPLRLTFCFCRFILALSAVDKPLLESESLDSVTGLKYHVLLSLMEADGDTWLIVEEGLPFLATKSDSPVLFRLKARFLLYTNNLYPSC